MDVKTRLAYLVILGALLGTPMQGTAALPAGNWRSQVSERLQSLVSPSMAAQPGGQAARFDSRGRVQITLSYSCATPVPLAELQAAGLSVSTRVAVAPLCATEGWAATGAVPALAALDGVLRVDLPRYAHAIGAFHDDQPAAAPGSRIDGEGIAIMQTDRYIQTAGHDGRGQTLGVISSDVASLALIQQRGELPAGIQLLPSSSAPVATDEGTMMLELMHAVAPGAGLAFCGPQTEIEYLACLQGLMAAGVTVIADDLGWPDDDLMSAQSGMAAAVQTLLGQHPGVMLFSSAGNDQQDYWQGAYAPQALAAPLSCGAGGQLDRYAQDFGGAAGDALTVVGGLHDPMYLQWADAFDHNVSGFDLYLLDAGFNVVACATGAGATEPVDALQPPVLAPGRYYLMIATPDQAAAGKFLKLIANSDGAASLAVTSAGSTASPQKFLAAVTDIGAVAGDDSIGDRLEAYSAEGPVTLQLPALTSVQSPMLMAPDGVSIDAGGTAFAAIAPYGRFYGTSAAAPNSAAVAGLLLATFPGITGVQVLAALKSGAAMLGATAPDAAAGYGRIDALGALNALPEPSVSAIPDQNLVGGTRSTLLQFTVSGTGSLAISRESDDDALVQLSTSDGIQLLPADCGVSTFTCTLSITPTLGLRGLSHIKIVATDGAGRKGYSVFAVNVTPPPPPSLSLSTGSLSSAGGSVSLSASMGGTGALHVGYLSSAQDLVPIAGLSADSSCGSQTLTCTITVTPAAGAVGSATVTVVVTDAYRQTAQQQFVVRVDRSLSAQDGSSHSGGGGASGLIVLCLLSGAVLQRRTRRLSL